jgi:hypothetical protein
MNLASLLQIVGERDEARRLCTELGATRWRACSIWSASAGRQAALHEARRDTLIANDNLARLLAAGALPGKDGAEPSGE